MIKIIITILFATCMFSQIAVHAATFNVETDRQKTVETALRSVDASSWIFRPNNLYRVARYHPNSAVCESFPGTNETRIACSVAIEAIVDTCTSQT